MKNEQKPSHLTVSEKMIMLKETYYAFLFFSLSFSVLYLFCIWKILKVKKGERPPTEAPFLNRKHCSSGSGSGMCEVTNQSRLVIQEGGA